MNWDAIGAIGEIIGAVAVVVTLLVLIVQLRQNTNEMKASTVQSLLDTSTALFSDTMSSPVPDIMAKQNAGDALTSAEEIRLQLFVRRNFQLFEQVYIQFCQDRISREIMDAYNARIGRHFGNDLWESQWEYIAPFLTASFRSYVEGLQNDA